jgi:glyoxalase family protein
MSLTIPGLHHVTAISADPRQNADFYTRVMGLRLVKRTVNFDDEDTYHLYYGDGTGRPGTILTFFVRLHDKSGHAGKRQVTKVRFNVPPRSLGLWEARLVKEVGVSEEAVCGDVQMLSFRDPDGLPIQLVGAPDVPAGASSRDPRLSPHAIRGLHSVELSVPELAPTCALLTDVMGFKEMSSRAQWRRFAAAGAGPGLFVDVRADAELPDASIGVGSVHHVAFRARAAKQQRVWQRLLRQAGLDVTSIRDRKYFQSIYFCEPGGIRFEIATDAPGFAVDEPPRELGRRLQLPAALESARAALEARLGALPISSAEENPSTAVEPTLR